MPLSLPTKAPETIALRVLVSPEVRDRLRAAKAYSGLTMAEIITNLVMEELEIPGE